MEAVETGDNTGTFEGTVTYIQMNSVAHKIDNLGLNHRILEATLRFEMLDNILKDLTHLNQNEIENQSRSERVDKILTHKWLGPLIFLTLLYGIFQSIFIWATIPMQYIDSGVTYLGNYCVQLFSPGILRDLLVEGIISGVGAILIFLPQKHDPHTLSDLVHIWFHGTNEIQPVDLDFKTLV